MTKVKSIVLIMTIVLVTALNSMSVQASSLPYITAIWHPTSCKGVGALVVNPKTGYLYATCYDSNTVAVIDTATGLIVSTIPVQTHPMGIALNPATNLIYVSNLDSNSVSVINPETNTVQTTITNGIGRLPYGSDAYKNLVFVAEIGAGVAIIDGNTNTVTQTISGLGSPFDVAVSPPNDHLFITQSGSGILSVYTIAGQLVANVQVGGTPDPDGVDYDQTHNYVFVGNQFTRNVVVVDAYGNKIVGKIDVDKPSSTGKGAYVVVDPYANYAYATNGPANTLSVINTGTLSLVEYITLASNPSRMAVFYKHNIVYVSNGGDTISVIQE